MRRHPQAALVAEAIAARRAAYRQMMPNRRHRESDHDPIHDPPCTIGRAAQLGAENQSDRDYPESDERNDGDAALSADAAAVLVGDRTWVKRRALGAVATCEDHERRGDAGHDNQDRPHCYIGKA